MNEVTLSGVLKGGFEEVSNDGVKLTLVNRSQREDFDNEEFIVLAYGNAASFLTQHAESGNRVIIQGRISSEKLGTENYHHAITASRVLGICDSSQGMDYSHAVVSGLATSEGVKHLSNAKQTAVLGLNVASVREYKDRDGKVQQYTTYLGGTLWGANAEDFAARHTFPMQNVPVTFDGQLKPRTYENRDGNEIYKIDVWANNVVVGTSSGTSEVPEAQTESQARSSSTRTKSKKLVDAPF